jgi:hypothetical protein
MDIDRSRYAPSKGCTSMTAEFMIVFLAVVGIAWIVSQNW